MRLLKNLFLPVAAVLALSTAGPAMAVSPENSAAFYANAQKAYALGLAGQRMAALLHCELYLTMAVPNPNDPGLANTRRGLRDMCTRAIAGNSRNGTNFSFGPFPVYRF